jgi:hypothetical protein
VHRKGAIAAPRLPRWEKRVRPRCEA